MNGPVSNSLATVLARFPLGAGSPTVAPVASRSSFSGAEVWRVTQGERSYALRAWPLEHPEPARLAWMHEVLRQVERRSGSPTATLSGRIPIPVPLLANDGRSFFEFASRRWELAPWLPGVPGDQLPATTELVEAAFTSLARFHRVAAEVQLPCPGWESLEAVGMSPGIEQRRQQLRSWAGEQFRTLDEAARRLRPVWPEFSELAARWVAATRESADRVLTLLEQAARTVVPLQICLRDVKCDHLLFVEGRVSGIVDFGAMRVDSVAADLARLLGSFTSLDTDRERAARVAYETIRPLSAYERWLIDVFAESGTLLGGGNWIDWVAVQGRQFEHPDAVLIRFRSLVERLIASQVRR